MKLKPMIVAALGDKAVEDAPRVKALGADMVEIRMDLVKGDPLEAVGTAACQSGLPIIVTNRMRSEGGAFVGSEEERIDLLLEASAYADFIDIELRAEARDWLLKKLDLPSIISYHDFSGMPSPEELQSILNEMAEAGALISKIAATPKSLRDNLNLLELLTKTDRLLCVIAMGEMGRHMRVMAPIYGSVLTYGYVSSATAPGQMSVAELRHAMEILRPGEKNDP
jgi:3-dehydroquinate dehydratase-1